MKWLHEFFFSLIKIACICWFTANLSAHINTSLNQNSLLTLLNKGHFIKSPFLYAMRVYKSSYKCFIAFVLRSFGSLWLVIVPLFHSIRSMTQRQLTTSSHVCMRCAGAFNLLWIVKKPDRTTHHHRKKLHAYSGASVVVDHPRVKQTNNSKFALSTKNQKKENYRRR